MLLMRPYLEQIELDLLQTKLYQQLLTFCLERIELDVQ